jgi:hypothetical protein
LPHWRDTGGVCPSRSLFMSSDATLDALYGTLLGRIDALER